MQLGPVLIRVTVRILHWIFLSELGQYRCREQNKYERRFQETFLNNITVGSEHTETYIIEVDVNSGH